MLKELRRIMTWGKGSPRKRILICLSHVLLWPLLLVPRLFWPWRRRAPLGDNPRILLIRIDGIGDLAMSSAIFPALRSRYPNGRIDLLTSDVAYPVGQLLLAEKWIDALWQMPLLHRKLKLYRALMRELRAIRYDAIVDLRSDMRNVLLAWLVGAPHRLGLFGSGMSYLLTDSLDIPEPHHQTEEPLALVRRLGVQQFDPWPRLPLQPEHLGQADRWLADHAVDRDRPIVAMHVGAFLPSKIWPLERFVEVGKRLRDDVGAQIVLVGGRSEIELAAEFQRQFDSPVAIAAGDASLVVTAGILSRCALMIGNDSGPAHVAGAVGCPVVVLFGNGNPRIYGVRSPHAALLQSPHPCDPRCNKTCARPERRCMLDLTVEQVAVAATSLIRAAPPAPAGSPSSRPPASN